MRCIGNDEEDLAACVRCCWSNPVKHGFMGRPEDWPFSSFHRDGRPPVAGWMRA
jgi:putative transposase